MTISEMEKRSGMTRANIRFYEAQGLLSPRRLENGYRDYTDAELDTLLRIRLLRTLGVSLDELRALQSGEAELPSLLRDRAGAISAEQAELELKARVCRSLLQSGAGWDTLDAAVYLSALESGSVPEGDAIETVRAPFRRFFARIIDHFILMCLWGSFLTLVLGMNLSARENGAQLIDWFAALLLTLALEPALLHFFGTTPGKALMGLSVTDPDGGRLSYAAGFDRTAGALGRGLGLNVPLIRLWRLYKSFDACANDRGLGWEENSILVLRPNRRRTLMAALLCLLALGTLFFSFQFVTVPRHRGHITVAEFADNFNRLAEYHQIIPDMRLTPEGDWIDYGGSIVSFNIGGSYTHDWGYPDFEYTVEKGLMTGLSFEMHSEGEKLWPPSLGTEQSLAVLAFVRAQKGFFAFGDETADALLYLDGHPYENWDYAANGVLIHQEVKHSGYTLSGGYPVPNEGDSQSFTLRFSMELDG